MQDPLQLPTPPPQQLQASLVGVEGQAQLSLGQVPEQTVVVEQPLPFVQDPPQLALPPQQPQPSLVGVEGQTQLSLEQVLVAEQPLPFVQDPLQVTPPPQ